MSKRNGRRHTAASDGPDKQLCDAKRANSTEHCRRPAGWGTEHAGIGRCKWHGGATESHCKAAKKTAAIQAVATYGLPRDIDPHEALIEEVQRTAGHVRWLEIKYHELPEDQIQNDPIAVMYRAERRHGLDVYRAAIGAGIAEREVRIAEGTGQVIAQALQMVLTWKGVADDDDVPGLVRRALMSIEGGVAA